MARQAPNVSRMRLLGAEVVGVDAGSRTLKDAINEAMRDWTENVATTHYVLGSALGPHPYPAIVREFQSVIGREARAQMRRLAGRDPRRRGRVRGRRLQRDRPLRRVPEDAASRSTASRPAAAAPDPGEHAARFSGGAAGVLHGTRTMVLQDEAGQILPTHSVSAGLDYPAVGPEHASLHDSGRVTYARGRTPRRWMPSRFSARPRASCPRSSRLTRLRSRRSSRGASRGRPGSWSTSPAGETRTSTNTCACGPARAHDPHLRGVRARPQPRGAPPSSRT